MSMPVELMTAHPRVIENTGRVAIMRGPLVYCVEQCDNEGFDVWDLAVHRNARFRLEWDGNIIGGIMKIIGDGYAVEDEWGALYMPIDKLRYRIRSIEFRAIPYYAWANRNPGPMNVWIRLLGNSIE
jgi:DUF1680 family protein